MAPPWRSGGGVSAESRDPYGGSRTTSRYFLTEAPLLAPVAPLGLLAVDEWSNLGAPLRSEDNDDDAGGGGGGKGDRMGDMIEDRCSSSSSSSSAPSRVRVGYNFEPAGGRRRMAPLSLHDESYVTGDAAVDDRKATSDGAPSVFSRAVANDRMANSTTTKHAERRARTERKRADRRARGALEAKQVESAKHARWLDPPPPGKKKGAGVEKEEKETWQESRTAAVGRPSHATTAYRAAMRTGGAGHRSLQRVPRRVGSSFVMFAEASFDAAHSAAKRDRSRCLETVVAVGKTTAELLRYEKKCETVARWWMCLDNKSSNRTPALQLIEGLCDVLRSTAGENPDPAVVSRRQFVHVATATVDNLEDRDANAMFSSLEYPRGIDRVRVGALAATLYAARKVGASIGAALLSAEDRARCGHAKTSGISSSSSSSNHPDDASVTTMIIRCLPILRFACLAYDPERDGIQPDEVRELCTAAATTRGHSDAIAGLLASRPETFGRRLSVPAFLDAFVAFPSLSGEFDAQIRTFQATVAKYRQSEVKTRVRRLADDNARRAEYNAAIHRQQERAKNKAHKFAGDDLPPRVFKPMARWDSTELVPRQSNTAPITRDDDDDDDGPREDGVDS